MNRNESLIVGLIFLGVFSILMIITVIILSLLKKERERDLKMKLLIHYYLGPIGFFIKEEKNKIIKNIASVITTIAYISLFVILLLYK